MTAITWPPIIDEDLVERLIPAIQKAITEISASDQGTRVGVDVTEVNASDTANALLMILATLLERSPACSTPRGIRLLAEAAGKELAALIRDTQQLMTSTLN